MGNLISEMKGRIAKSGSSKKEILYFGENTVKRIRFLQELDTGYMFSFHSDYNAHILELCKDPEDHENCKLCKDDIKLVEKYCWSVWDYDSNAKKILCFKVTGLSPVPALIEDYEEFGTIMDRDYKIKKVGKGMGASFTVTPLDKSRFRNNEDPFTEVEIKQIFEKAYVSSDIVEDDDEEEETPKKRKKENKVKSLREKFEDLTMKELKKICIEVGMTKKEFSEFEDEEDAVEALFNDYEEVDLEELLEDLED